MKFLCPDGLEVKHNDVKSLQLDCRNWLGTNGMRLLCPDGQEVKHNDVGSLRLHHQYWPGTSGMRLLCPNDLEAEHNNDWQRQSDTSGMWFLCSEGPEENHNDVRFLQLDCYYWPGTDVLWILCTSSCIKNIGVERFLCADSPQIVTGLLAPIGLEARHNELRLLQPVGQYWPGTSRRRFLYPVDLGSQVIIRAK